MDFSMTKMYCKYSYFWASILTKGVNQRHSEENIHFISVVTGFKIRKHIGVDIYRNSRGGNEKNQKP